MTESLKIFMAIEVTVCFIPGLLLRYYPFQDKITPKQKKVLWGIYLAVILLNILFLMMALKSLETATGLVRLDILLIQIFLVLANLLVIQEFRKEHIYTFGVTSTCMYMLLSIASFFPKYFTGMNEIEQYLLGTAIHIVLSVLCYPIVRYLLKITVIPFLHKSCRAYWKYVWFIPLMLYVAMFMAIPMNEDIETFQMLCSRVFISVAVIIFSYVTAVGHKHLMEKEVLVEQLENSREHYADLQARVESSRKVKHDMKHFISAVRHYIETDDKSGLVEFCTHMEDEVLSHSNVPCTGNQVVDSVFYQYLKKAKENDIDFQFQGRIAEQGISSIELCVLLGNALENAVAGCLTIPKNRHINVIAETDQDVMSIMIRNSFDGKVHTVSDKIFSRKREHRVGVGLESMRSICERNQGSMKAEWEENTFTVLFVLSLQSNT